MEKVEEIQEGNKKYYRIAGLMVTESAFKNLHQLATGAGLRIRLNPGGCSGYKYLYDFFEAPEEDEKTYPLSDNLAIFMNDFTREKSEGAVIDYQIGLHGSGLQIINKNAKNACSCGVSMGF